MCALFRRDSDAAVVELWEETTWLQRHGALVWRTGALALWGGTLIWFYWADKLILYTKPVYHPLALGAGVLLTLLALKGLLGLATQHRSPDCCHGGHGGHEHHHASGRLAALVVIVPLVINALVPSTGLTSYAVGKRTTDIDFSSLAGQMAADWEAQLAEAEGLDQEYPELTIAQILTLAAQDPVQARGRKLSCIGFVYHEEGLPEGINMLVRFRMWCCAADAQPMYLPIRLTQQARVESDQWLKVRGVLTFAQVRGQNAPLLEADYVDTIKRPRNQYM